MNQTINRSQVEALINKTAGLMFSVEFIKKDNTLRKMTARTRVKSHLHGGHSTTSHKKNLVTVFDMNAVGYRNINIDTIQKIKYAGVTYDVI